jgi:hypothetical protein
VEAANADWYPHAGRWHPTAGGTVNSGPHPSPGNVSVSGTDSDGVITPVAAFLRAGLTLWGFASGPSCAPLIAAAVVAALVGLVVAIDLADVAGRIAHADAGDAPVSASMGIGLWLVLLRAIARVAVCDLKLASWRKQMVRCGSIRQAMRSGADSPRAAQPARSGRYALLPCPARTTRYRRSGAAFNLDPSCAGVAFRTVVAGEDQHRRSSPAIWVVAPCVRGRLATAPSR